MYKKRNVEICHFRIKWKYNLKKYIVADALILVRTRAFQHAAAGSFVPLFLCLWRSAVAVVTYTPLAGCQPPPHGDTMILVMQPLLTVGKGKAGCPGRQAGS